MSIELPKDISKPDYKNPRLLILYGFPKIGKTTVCAEFTLTHNALLVDLEEGSNYVEARKLKVNSLSELNEFMKTLDEENKKINGYVYDYLIIDTLTKLDEWAEELAQRNYLASSLRDKDFKSTDSILNLPRGAGYNWLRKAFGKIFTNIIKLAPYIIFVAHIKDSELVDAQGQPKQFLSVNSALLDLTGKLRTICAYKVDAIGFMAWINKKDEKGNLVFDEKNKLQKHLAITFNSSTDEIFCGVRNIPRLKGQTFEFDWNKIYID